MPYALSQTPPPPLYAYATFKILNCLYLTKITTVLSIILLFLLYCYFMPFYLHFFVPVEKKSTFTTVLLNTSASSVFNPVFQSMETPEIVTHQYTLVIHWYPLLGHFLRFLMC